MNDYDVIIIGSGFGGAVAAYDLTQAGLKVCLLERGPWFNSAIVNDAKIVNTRPFPNGMGFFHRVLRGFSHHVIAPGGITLNKNGMFEIFSSSSVNVICSNGVGGGSNAYSGLHARPLQGNYWDKAGLSPEIMEPHYLAVLEQFKSRPAAEDTAANYFATEEKFIAPELHQETFWGYQSASNNDRNWHKSVDFLKEGMFGSPSGAKVSLAETCIIPAMKNGLDVKDMIEATQIANIEKNHFVVMAKNHSTGKPESYSARKIIVAAGCINTIKLLNNSISSNTLPLMPALGKHFSTNADIMAFWAVNNKHVNHAAHGPSQKILYPAENKNTFQILQAGISGLSAIPLPQFIRKYFYRQVYLAAMGLDNADGRITFNNGKLIVNFDATQDPVIQNIKKHVKWISSASCKKAFIPKKLSTVHPLGGAVISDNEHEGVVNNLGEIHNAKGVFIADASVFPSALGSPPSLSIAAWSRHVASHIISDHKM